MELERARPYTQQCKVVMNALQNQVSPVRVVALIFATTVSYSCHVEAASKMWENLRNTHSMQHLSAPFTVRAQCGMHVAKALCKLVVSALTRQPETQLSPPVNSSYKSE